METVTDQMLNAIREKLETYEVTLNEKSQRTTIRGIIEDIRKCEEKAKGLKICATCTHEQLWNSKMNHRRSPGSEDCKEADKKLGKKFPEKIFVARESYLTSLLEVDHIRGIYHIFFVILSVLVLNSVLSDYFVEGRLNFGLLTVKGGFRGLHFVFGVWLGQHIFVFGLYYAFKMWASIRYSLDENKALQTFWSYSCIMSFMFFQLFFGYVGTATCLKFDLPFVSSSVILLETIRLIMKMHAFVRTNAACQLTGKLKTSTASTVPIRVVTFASYLYYLFAPTFIFRESYPRTKQIRWKFAAARLTEIVAIAMFYSYIYEQFMHPIFENFGKERLTYPTLAMKFVSMLMPSVIILLCGFYMILHSWLNFTSELLRFADRMFYKDWWTATNYEGYYRNWNIVVHDWLYEFIYKDAYLYVFKGSKLASTFSVFFISALAHEHVLGFGLKFFYPVMYVFFAFVGVFLIFVTKHLPKRFGNFCLWFSLVTGNGTLISLYLMEFYARRNCSVGNMWTEYFVPISWRCNGLSEIN